MLPVYICSSGVNCATAADRTLNPYNPFAAAFAGIVRDPESVRLARVVRSTTADPITDPAEIRAALAAQMQAVRGDLHTTALPWPESTAPDAP